MCFVRYFHWCVRPQENTGCSKCRFSINGCRKCNPSRFEKVKPRVVRRQLQFCASQRSRNVQCATSFGAMCSCMVVHHRGLAIVWGYVPHRLGLCAVACVFVHHSGFAIVRGNVPHCLGLCAVAGLCISAVSQCQLQFCASERSRNVQCATSFVATRSCMFLACILSSATWATQKRSEFHGVVSRRIHTQKHDICLTFVKSQTNDRHQFRCLYLRDF